MYDSVTMNNCDDRELLQDVFSELPLKNPQSNKEKPNTVLVVFGVAAVLAFGVVAYLLWGEYIGQQPMFPYAL